MGVLDFTLYSSPAHHRAHTTHEEVSPQPVHCVGLWTLGENQKTLRRLGFFHCNVI